jgi:flagellar hook assembly protein FlgD
MWNGQDTLYGNEWIAFDQSYFKIPVAEDGLYRLDFTSLQNSGIPLSSISHEHFQLFHLGKEIPLFVSASGDLLTNGDFIEFYGQKNRSEIDQYLFANPEEEMLNPYFSLFSDTSAYFLTWNLNQSGLRYDIIENDLSNLPPKEEWYWQEERLVLSDRQVQKTYTQGVAESVLEKGEGFASQYSTNLSYQLQTSNVYTGTTDSAQYDIRMVSSSGYTHNLEIKVNGSLKIEEDFPWFALKKYTFKTPVNTINSIEQINVDGGTESNDRYALASINLAYPRSFNFQGSNTFSFNLEAGNTSQYLEVENFNISGEVVLYNLSNQQRIQTLIEENLVKVKVPNDNQESKLLLQNVNSGWQPATLSPVSFINYGATNSDFIILSNKKLYDDGQGNNRVQEYADYRSSAAGGNYNVSVVEIQQLYDQFAYGIPLHPISIRNFGHFVDKNWADSKFMLLIGKGRHYDAVRTSSQLSDESNKSFFVPTFGKPGSDNLLLASTHSQVPVLAIGRIPASNPTDIKYYLDKIKTHESGLLSGNESDRSWRKELLHLGGGGNPSEQLTLKTHLEQMANIIEQNEFGGNVYSFYKTSAEPVQQSQSDDLTNRINSGASMITFFGHSGTGGFDFSIDDPTTYHNNGRYPLMLSLGCLSGQIHLDFKSVGEKFIFQEEKAALGFLATTGYGYISPLSSAAKKIYEYLGTDYYGKGIGEIIQKTLSDFDASTGIPTRTLVQQLTLNGDPALAVSPFNKPDYTFDISSVGFSPMVIDAQRDSFELQFTIKNIGRAVSDSFYLEITREFPDDSQVLINKEKIKAPSYSKTLTYKIPVNGTRAIGSNRFYIRLDTENDIDEGPLPSGEDNNELENGLGATGVELFIFANQVSAASPKEFNIVGTPAVSLKATTADPFAEVTNYIFQIDTTSLFNSTNLQQTILSQKGGLIEWEPSLNWQDSTVYYWRVSVDSTNGFGYIWDNSSFIYIQESPEGWNQSHYFQYLDDYYENMEIREENRKFNYLEDVKFIRIQNGVYPAIWPNINFNNTPYSYIAWNESTNGGVYIAVMDSITVDPWLNNPPGLYGSRLDNSWAYGWGVFPYSTQTEAQREKVINFLQDTIPSGNYIAIYTIQHNTITYEPEEWAGDSINLSTNLFQVLEGQGATQIRESGTSGAVPYVFIYKKDDPSFTPIEVTGNLDDPLNVVVDIPGIWDSGAIKTLDIGPASSWDKLIWNKSEQEPLDKISLEVFGVREDASKALLVENLSVSDTTLNWISAEEFPNLQLRYSTSDTLHRTTPQLDFWRVLFEGIPDAVINSNKHYLFHNDTLQQGETLNLEFTVENISRYNMDSLLISFLITDETNNIILKEKRYPPLPGNDELIANFSLDTRQLSGMHSMMIEVNPHNDQSELSHENNVGLLDFYIEKDKRNPLLDVTFDSERILDGDLVSAKPHIIISLLDENKYLPLNDTTQLNILIKRPGEGDVSPIYFSSPFLQFFPAEEGQLNQQNKAVVEFDPQFTEDGIYELIIQGEDATGNQSGSLDYKVNFEVITATSLSNILNYPNPFTHSTKFVYTLTGDEPPPYFSIQIMTVSGRIVRTLTQDDLGPLKPGTHQTEFAWNGTDEYGDRLANGVYIYKVTAKDENGQALDKYKNESADQFFQKGYGKMVILR